jgi:hypothetical protein
MFYLPVMVFRIKNRFFSFQFSSRPIVDNALFLRIAWAILMIRYGRLLYHETAATGDLKWKEIKPHGPAGTKCWNSM